MANLLKDDFTYFPDSVMQAAHEGRLDAAPLVRMLERAAVVANGVAAVLEIEAASLVYLDIASEENPEPPIAGSTMYNLLALARHSAHTLVSEIETVASRAERDSVIGNEEFTDD
ncbi:hypothetical protein [Paraburkholderia ferrariae]|uniref:hypothetical protein n=1 Tax=Paraburkholderia ferrariae TaxID=386056 RepID=UPI00048789F0|nr:hypothetical protein [Paraburkholderia ferrariae]